MNKRFFLKSLVLSTTGISFLGLSSGFRSYSKQRSWNGVFTMPPFEYGNDEFMPFIDAQTMESHKALLAGYTKNLNDAVQRLGLKGRTAVELCKRISEYPDQLKEYAGGFYNHKLFWRILSPEVNIKMNGDLLNAINMDFGSWEVFKKKFKNAGVSLSGSGWVWLLLANGRLKITTTSGNDNPLMDLVPDKGHPLLCLDLWGHAYDNIFKGNREEYIDAFWTAVNWNTAERRYLAFRNI